MEGRENFEPLKEELEMAPAEVVQEPQAGIEESRSEENLSELKKAIENLGLGASVAFKTDSHARIEGFISDLRGIYEEVPHLIILTRPFKRVRVDLKNIKKIL